MIKKFNWKGVNIKKIYNLTVSELSLNENFEKYNLILPKFLNRYITVYDGKVFNKLLITDKKIGYKVGEFIRTRKEFSFKKKKSGSKN